MSISKYFRRNHKSLSGWIEYQQDDYSSFLMSLLCPQKNELILDDGSGNGRFSVTMANEGSNVISLDINKRILKVAAENCKQEKLSNRIEPILGDIQNLPFKDYVFDKVLCVHNLWCVPGYQRAVSEMFRTLKEKGEVLIDHLNLLNWHLFIGELIYIFMKILRRNPTPIFYRTPRQIMHPFDEFQVEVFNFFSHKGRILIAKGKSSKAPRLIVKCSKSSSQIS